MRKLLTLLLIVLLSNCSGYTPIFSSKDTNFYIAEIVISNDNKLTRNLIKKLKPYTIKNDQKKIILELDMKVKEAVTLKDEKGNIASEEMEVILEVKSILENAADKKFLFTEKFTFNDQSNKFELNQYKKNIQNNLVDKIYQDLILILRTL